MAGTMDTRLTPCANLFLRFAKFGFSKQFDFEDRALRIS